jgi:ribosome biogenesis protein SSF1/2
LAELGPRLTMKLMKVERGFMEGDVIYHDYIKKAPEEVRALEAKAKAGRELKKRRREEQEGNVARKERKMQEAKERKEERMKERAARREAEGGKEGEEGEESEEEESEGEGMLSEDEEV